MIILWNVFSVNPKKIINSPKKLLTNRILESILWIINEPKGTSSMHKNTFAYEYFFYFYFRNSEVKDFCVADK